MLFLTDQLNNGTNERTCSNAVRRYSFLRRVRRVTYHASPVRFKCLTFVVLRARDRRTDSDEKNEIEREKVCVCVCVDGTGTLIV